MKKFACAVAATALLATDAEASLGHKAGHYHSSWAKKRVGKMKHKLERTYGRGMVDLYGMDGRIDPEKFIHTDRRMGGSKLGSNISVTVRPGLTIDAATKAAFWLGFVNGMQYEGLNRDSAEELLPTEDVQLTNCFASTYALIESFDTAMYNIKTFSSVTGTLKIFDVLALDPIHIVGDLTVEWEMCQVATIVDQFKGMASLDYASMSNTLTRELLVIALESPEAFEQVRAIAEAAQCSAKAINASEDGEGEDEEAEEEAAWSTFVSDEDIADAQAKADAVADCTGDLDRWTTGKIFGRLFARFFDQELKPNI